MVNTCFAHLMVFIGSLLLLMLPDSHVSPGFRAIPDADFEPLYSAPGPCRSDPA